MALKLLSVWGHTPRPWGHEVRCDFVDDNGRIWNEVLTWPAKPAEKAIDAAVAARLEAVTARVAAEAVEALKPREATREDLVAKVAALEAEKVVLTAERDALVAAKVVAPLERVALDG